MKKAECVRLRIEERLSLREIHQRTGVAKSTLSGWLKSHPLTKDELAMRQRLRPRGGKRKSTGDESVLYKRFNGDFTSQEKAKIAEAAVLLRLCLCGFQAFGSPFDGERTDWLVETPSRVVKIQVKWVDQKKHGMPTVPLTHRVYGTTKKVKYAASEFDFIVGYDFFSDKAYVFSYNDVEGHKATISVRKDAEEAWHKLT